MTGHAKFILYLLSNKISSLNQYPVSGTPILDLEQSNKFGNFFQISISIRKAKKRF